MVYSLVIMKMVGNIDQVSMNSVVQKATLSNGTKVTSPLYITLSIVIRVLMVDEDFTKNVVQQTALLALLVALVARFTAFRT